MQARQWWRSSSRRTLTYRTRGTSSRSKCSTKVALWKRGWKRRNWRLRNRNAKPSSAQLFWRTRHHITNPDRHRSSGLFPGSYSSQENMFQQCTLFCPIAFKFSIASVVNSHKLYTNLKFQSQLLLFSSEYSAFKTRVRVSMKWPSRLWKYCLV